jgi:hypothetical protein
MKRVRVATASMQYSYVREWSIPLCSNPLRSDGVGVNIEPGADDYGPSSVYLVENLPHLPKRYTNW